MALALCFVCMDGKIWLIYLFFFNFYFSFYKHGVIFLHTPWEREHPKCGLINTVNSFPFTQICALLKCVCQWHIFFSLFSCLPVIRTMSTVVILNVSFLFIKHICLIDLFFFFLCLSMGLLQEPWLIIL